MVELNPDPSFRSDRPEWCYVHYDRLFHPQRSFQLEMQWMVSTVTLFNQLVRGGRLFLPLPVGYVYGG